MTNEDKETLKNCWVMTTNHGLDDENKKLKTAITNVLKEIMTPEELSRLNYEYFIQYKQYNSDLDYNITLIKDWSYILKGQGNINYKYAYAIDRVLEELNKRGEIK